MFPDTIYEFYCVRGISLVRDELDKLCTAPSSGC